MSYALLYVVFSSYVIWYNARKVNEVFVIGSLSIVSGASSWSYNKFVGLHNGVNFIIPHETLVPCRDSFFPSASWSALQMIVKLLCITSNLQRLQSTHKPPSMNSLINLYKLLIHYIPQENVLQTLALYCIKPVENLRYVSVWYCLRWRYIKIILIICAVRF